MLQPAAAIVYKGVFSQSTVLAVTQSLPVTCGKLHVGPAIVDDCGLLSRMQLASQRCAGMWATSPVSTASGKPPSRSVGDQTCLHY
jgi:hypothetical protein